jgi:tetratricopeptide (TPR) repeat protein
MAKKKKVTRKQLLKEPDEFITTTGKIINWGRQHQRHLTRAAILLGIVLIVVSGWRFLAFRAEKTATALLEDARGRYTTLKNDQDATQAFQAVKDDFETLVRKYSRRQAGKLATVVYANIAYEGGDHDLAIALFKKVQPAFVDSPFTQELILSGLGYAYAAKQDYPTALTYFTRLAEQPDAVFRDEALFHIAWLNDLLGKPNESLDAYRKIISDHAGSLYIDIAQSRVDG